MIPLQEDRRVRQKKTFSHHIWCLSQISPATLAALATVAEFDTNLGWNLERITYVCIKVSKMTSQFPGPSRNHRCLTRISAPLKCLLASINKERHDVLTVNFIYIYIYIYIYTYYDNVNGFMIHHAEGVNVEFNDLSRSCKNCVSSNPSTFTLPQKHVNIMAALLAVTNYHLAMNKFVNTI